MIKKRVNSKPKRMGIGAHFVIPMLRTGRKLVALVSLVGLLISQTSAGLLAAVRCPAASSSCNHGQDGEKSCCCGCCDGCEDEVPAPSETGSSVRDSSPNSPSSNETGCPHGCAYCAAANTVGFLAAVPATVRIADLAETFVESLLQIPSTHPGKLIRPPRA